MVESPEGGSGGRTKPAGMSLFFLWTVPQWASRTRQSEDLHMACTKHHCRPHALNHSEARAFCLTFLGGPRDRFERIGLGGGAAEEPSHDPAVRLPRI